MEFGPLKVRLYGDPCLEAKSKPVKEVGPVERMLISAMFETMAAYKGVGLAAPQVGINEQIFVVDTGKETFVVVNPKIVKSVGHDVMEEGCLSIPRVLVDVKRAKTVWVEYIDAANRRVRAQLNGLVAKVFQHEYDHLQGKLILDYLNPRDRSKILSQLKNGSYVGKVLGDDDAYRTKI
ncbi:MAG: peptide deformylase [Candidatus Omnitrophica bacterium]|nr:peptide deformylase [Candidatus Omnitrophota bacterium]MDE2009199.1 peptide deformylase [Candidatus Omnitrophota bacterium]MDE2213720.1 peptide deformylase [Candidatus Omnitrophota bacterium]MDE2230705.1 peptide deformylase [Candidatus Omnitrophota bacterium]